MLADKEDVAEEPRCSAMTLLAEGQITWQTKGEAGDPERGRRGGGGVGGSRAADLRSGGDDGGGVGGGQIRGERRGEGNP